MSGRPVLFLDIDGVLNGHEYDREAESSTLHPDCVARLNRVLADSECSVVLSSAWRYMAFSTIWTFPATPLGAGSSTRSSEYSSTSSESVRPWTSSSS